MENDDLALIVGGFSLALAIVSLVVSLHVHRVAHHHSVLDRLERGYFQLRMVMHESEHFVNELIRSGRAFDGTQTLSVTGLNLREPYQAPIVAKNHPLRAVLKEAQGPVIEIYETCAHLRLELKRHEIRADLGERVIGIKKSIEGAHGSLLKLASGIENQRSRRFV